MKTPQSPAPVAGRPLTAEDVEIIRDYWSAYADADWHLIPEAIQDDFDARLVAVGLAEWRAVTADDLDDAFAHDRGLEAGGSCLDLTALGYLAFKADADGWMPWSGGENPVGETKIDVRFASRDEECGLKAERLRWSIAHNLGDIIAFRLSRPASEQPVEAIGWEREELVADLHRRADACHDLMKPGLSTRDAMRLHGKEAAYRHAAHLVNAALSPASPARTPMGGPVAWIERQNDGTRYGEPKRWPPSDRARSYAQEMGRTIEPLYAAASPARTPMGGETEEEDLELPDTPLARAIYKHFCDVHMLNPDEAADATGELLAAIAAPDEAMCSEHRPAADEDQVREWALIGLYLVEGRTTTDSESSMSIEWALGDRAALLADAEGWALEDAREDYNRIFCDRTNALSASPQPEAGEAVAWQRNHPVRGWIDCAYEDADHYRSVGQDIRALGVIAPPSVQPVEGK